MISVTDKFHLNNLLGLGWGWHLFDNSKKCEALTPGTKR